jgi:predicted DNA-binding ArsR family transcriptional regulator
MKKEITVDELVLEKYFEQDFLMVSKPLIRAIGLLGAVWVADIHSKFKYFRKNNMLNEEGEFFNTQENISRDTNISPFHQSEIVKRLKELEILHVKKKGLPAKNYYKFDYKKLMELIAEYAEYSEEENPSDLSEPGQSFIKNNLTQTNKSLINNIKDNNIKDRFFIDSKESIKNGAKRHFKKISSIPSKRPSYQEKSLKESYQEKNKKPALKQRNITPEMQELLSEWESLNLYVPNKNTNTYIDGVNKLFLLLYKGKPFNKKYTKEQILTSFKNFAKAALNEDYEPKPGYYKERLKKTPLTAFINNTFSKTDYDLFRFYLKNSPQPIIKLVEDTNPRLTRLLRKEINDVLRTTDEFTIIEQNKIINAAQKIKDFYERNDYIIRDVFPTDDLNKARFFVKAITDFYDNKPFKLSVGNFCTNHAVNSIFADFFQRNAVFITAEQGPISGIKRHLEDDESEEWIKPPAQTQSGHNDYGDINYFDLTSEAV